VAARGAVKSLWNYKKWSIIEKKNNIEKQADEYTPEQGNAIAYNYKPIMIMHVPEMK